MRKKKKLGTFICIIVLISLISIHVSLSLNQENMFIVDNIEALAKEEDPIIPSYVKESCPAAGGICVVNAVFYGGIQMADD